MLRRPPRSTRTDPLFPYTTLFRSCSALLRGNPMIVHLPHRTDRLLLRTLRLSDVEAFHGYRSREDVARLQGWSPMSREQALEFLRGEAADASLSPGVWRQIGIAMHDDVLAGDIGIHLSADLRVADFGLSIDPPTGRAH